MLFGENRVLKLALGKIVRVQRVQFGNQRPVSESQIEQLTHLSQVNSVAMGNSPRRACALFQNPEGYFKAISKIIGVFLYRARYTIISPCIIEVSGLSKVFITIRSRG